MDRRSFLKSLLVGAGILSLDLLMPKRLAAQTSTVKDWFDYYAECVGMYSANSLTRTNRAGRERRRVNNIMARSGYIYNHRGRVYQDYSNCSDLPKYVAPFDEASDVETYFVVCDNLVDICVPFYPNYSEGTRKAIMESPQVIGAAAAAAYYKDIHPNASSEELRDIFVPRGYINNPETDDRLSSQNTLGIYRTHNGELAIESNVRGNDMSLSVEASGNIRLQEDFDFSLSE